MVAKPSSQTFLPSENEISASPVKHLQQMTDDSYKVAFPIDGLGGVHEDITKAAAKTAGVPYTKHLEQGVESPDVPSEKTGKIDYLGLRNINKPGTLTYESHNGSKQFWHSMVPSDGQYTNGEVLSKIVNQAVAWFDAAKLDDVTKDNRESFYIGNVLHMVQDSFSPAHVIRDENGDVVSFQAYDKQDHAKHKDGEVKHWVEVENGPLGSEQGRAQTWQELPGAMAAYKASVKILELYKHGASSDELKVYLRQEVYQFQNEQTQYKPAGEIDPKYAPKEKNQIVEATSQVDDKYALMAKTYLEKTMEESTALYPDLANIHAKKAAISLEIADMHPKQQISILANFDIVAVNDISQGNIAPMQINSRAPAQVEFS